MHDDIRLGNMLGAAALAVSDLMTARVRAAAGVSASGPAALVVLAHASELSVTELGRRVGLSQPAAARMVDGLAAADLARRGTGRGRTVPVRLTPAGRRVVRDVLASRTEGLATVLADLDRDDRRHLTALLERLLTRLYDEVGDADLLCRLCDRTGCTGTGACPVGAAERNRAG